MVADLTTQDGLARAVELVRETPGLRLVVNNAGVTGPRRRPEDIALADWDAALAVRARIVETFVAQVAGAAQGADVPVAVHAALPAATVGSRVPLSPSLVADAVVLATDGLTADAASLVASGKSHRGTHAYAEARVPEEIRRASAPQTVGPEPEPRAFQQANLWEVA